jgi:hypothetical protein
VLATVTCAINVFEPVIILKISSFRKTLIVVLVDAFFTEFRYAIYNVFKLGDNETRPSIELTIFAVKPLLEIK